MNAKTARKEVIDKAITEIKESISDGVTIESLNAAKSILMALAERKDLFPRCDFPVPGKEQIYRTFLVHEENDGSFALYVNSSLPGQTSRPHDHGGSWAIIAAVEGEEIHRVYTTDDSSSAPCNIRQVGEIVVKPGTAISLMPEGIHAIDAESEEPLLHLHLYGMSFQHHTNRKEYDLVANEVKNFVLDDIGLIEDARLESLAE